MDNARILIVEDEAIIAMEIESHLQSLGYKVTSIVDTGEKAIKKAEEGKPDLILMDIRIKGEMDGIDTAEVIRNRFGIPVIFSTAYLDEERIERAKITMPFGYVLKPIQERDLKVTIEMALYISKVDEERGRAEKRFKTIFEEAPLGVALIDSLTGFIYEVNQKFADIAGRTRQEMATIDWISITHPDDVQEDLENMALLNAGEISGFNMNKRYVQPDGTFVWINMTIAPVFVEDKTQPRHLCMIEDITERKKMEESLKKSEEWFSTTLKSIGDAVITTDSKGYVTLLNPVAETLTGWKQEEAKGKSLKEVFNIINESTREP
ncbi:MAG: PAS domain S-box protein, partial [Bacteroidetes bacterium]|nr:PAS domain S-box protein [Bacteroidota bacterium]